MPSTKQKKFPSVLEAKTLDLYSKLPRSIKDVDIAEATGLTSSWISTFVSGKSSFVDTGRVEALYAYLTGKPLEL